ncbi:DUF3311 domain-containing protein [Pseudonocardia xinjiangensis]|uniref:DUF3311 domain-containing protein n=1 Tax=Pseudonocardia xinjiangensis TaxID=75289 RepID=A0ABX1RPR2_9PSEU|nr:DUF3311 domain-containing protein [Pseudonocardia xinjiangensis]
MSGSADRGNGSGELRWNAWNLLLLVPFLILGTPWINVAEPRLLGMPFFYWVQLAWVPFSVAIVAVVHVRTRGERGPSVPAGPDDVDALDTGATR